MLESIRAVIPPTRTRADDETDGRALEHAWSHLLDRARVVVPRRRRSSTAAGTSEFHDGHTDGTIVGLQALEGEHRVAAASADRYRATTLYARSAGSGFDVEIIRPPGSTCRTRSVMCNVVMARGLPAASFGSNSSPARRRGQRERTHLYRLQPVAERLVQPTGNGLDDAIGRLLRERQHDPDRFAVAGTLDIDAAESGVEPNASITVARSEGTGPPGDADGSGESDTTNSRCSLRRRSGARSA